VSPTPVSRASALLKPGSLALQDAAKASRMASSQSRQQSPRRLMITPRVHRRFENKLRCDGSGRSLAFSTQTVFVVVSCRFPDLLCSVCHASSCPENTQLFVVARSCNPPKAKRSGFPGRWNATTSRVPSLRADGARSLSPAPNNRCAVGIYAICSECP